MPLLMNVGFWVYRADGAGDRAARIVPGVPLYRKAGPHEALIAYGFRGAVRIVKGMAR